MFTTLLVFVLAATPVLSGRVTDSKGKPLAGVSVRVQGYDAASGVGRTKRQAEQAAATAVLMRESVWKDGTAA